MGSQSRRQDGAPPGIRRTTTSNTSDVISSAFETLSIMGFGISKSYTSPTERLWEPLEGFWSETHIKFGGNLSWLIFVGLAGLYFLIVNNTFYIYMCMRVIFLASELVSHDYFIAPDFSFTKFLCCINHYIWGKEGPVDGSIWTASFGFTHCWLQHNIILCLIKIWLFRWNLVALQKLPFDLYIFGIKGNLVQWFSNYLNWVFFFFQENLRGQFWENGKI